MNNPFIETEETEVKAIGPILNLDLNEVRGTKRGKHDDDIEALIEKFEAKEGNTLPVATQELSAAIAQRFKLGFKDWLDENNVTVRGIQTPMGMRELRKTHKYLIVLIPNDNTETEAE
jgi:hypothetical protein